MSVLMIAERAHLDEVTYLLMLQPLCRCCVQRTASSPTPGV
jgi:hypothetical protein